MTTTLTVTAGEAARLRQINTRLTAITVEVTQIAAHLSNAYLSRNDQATANIQAVSDDDMELVLLRGEASIAADQAIQALTTASNAVAELVDTARTHNVCRKCGRPVPVPFSAHVPNLGGCPEEGADDV